MVQEISFIGIAMISWLMAMPSIWLFTIGSIGCAVLFGLGNGGVFKLVPQYFSQQTGSVTGLVGAAGGLGGFFPPIVLGICRELTGSYAIGFGLLIVFALTCAVILSQTFLKSPAKISYSGNCCKVTCRNWRRCWRVSNNAPTC